jgi:hypothetical protein
LIIKLQLLVTKRLAYVFLENATDFSNKNNPTLILWTSGSSQRNTLNTLRMSVSGQSAPIPRNGSTAPRRPPVSVEGTTTAKETTKPHHSKVNKPDIYHGDRTGLEDWLTQVETYFIFYPVPDEQKALFASSFLRGRAQHWLKPNLRKYLGDNDEDEGRIFANFGKFKKKLRRIFGTSKRNE